MSGVRDEIPEMPVLLLGPQTGEAADLCCSDWHRFLSALAVSVFVSHSIDESQVIAEECRGLGTPIGLLVILCDCWDADAAAALRQWRNSASELDLAIYICCSKGQQDAAYAALEDGANECFLSPWDWPLIEKKVRRSLRLASRTFQLQSDKLHAEQLLSQHRQTASHQELWRLDLKTRNLDFSDKFKTLSALASSQVQASLEECLALIHPLDLSRLSKSLSGSDWRALPEELNFEFRLRQQDGSWRWILLRGRIENDEHGEPCALSGSHTDITEAKTIDHTTGLANRLQFEDWLMEARQSSGFSLMVILVGIDRFPLIRDSLGQSVGNQLLRLAADRLRSALATNERSSQEWILARLSEDEFAVALRGIEDAGLAMHISSSIQTEMAKGIWLQGSELFLSTSIGFVQEADRPVSDVIWRDAEIALQTARAEGGNRIVAFDQQMRRGVLERMTLETDLKRAVEHWEFEVYYQPKVTLESEQIIGFEALLRWRHPLRGIIAPGNFIPLAEETGLIIPIGIRTVREACHTIRRWQDEFPQAPPLEVSVNLSVRQFQDRSLVDEIRAILEETRILPSTLQIEVTESVLIHDPVQALELVTELRQMGVGLKIDDFGTGYSSLSYLHKLPFDSLKIDRSFISTMVQDHAAFEIVRAIILLAGSLGLHVVAEGIETRSQADELRNLGCAYGQGFLFAPPLTVEAAHKMLENQSRRQISGNT